MTLRVNTSAQARVKSEVRDFIHGRRVEVQQSPDSTFTHINQIMTLLRYSRQKEWSHQQDTQAKRIRTFVAGNLRSRITLKHLAQFLGYSEKYSSEFFQHQIGIPFSHYLKRLRILKAKLLLTGNGLSVTQIAETLGFSDSFAFSHFFKRAVGCSPTAFRKQHLLHISLKCGTMASNGNPSVGGSSLC